MYNLREDGQFQITYYQEASPFASFLPAISGTDGIPLWAFYVNRGQALASFGVENKDNAMLEFLPAHKAYQLTPTQGFRTFIKGKRGEKAFAYEPFKDQAEEITDAMGIADNTLELQHVNEALGLTIDVLYYSLPHEPIPGLIREVTLTNNREDTITIDALDGLASLFPAHVGDAGYKAISNTMKSWFDAEVIEDTFAYYFMRGSTADDAKVDQSDEGNFYVSLLQKGEEETIISPLFDRDYVFGNDLSLSEAKAFFGKKEEGPLKQVGTNKVSCAFTPFSVEMKGKESVTLTSLFGQVSKREGAKAFIDSRLTSENLKAYKASAKTLAQAFTKRVETKTANPLFDAYVKQNYLDNGLRGGFPVLFENEEASQVFYLYSRKHGDLERDYNFFSISPEYYSQGNGNYRDMNQNRRLDIFVEPKVEDRAIKQFMSLIQLDGYNPLSIKTVTYQLRDKELDLSPYGLTEEDSQVLLTHLTDGFTPGSLKRFIEENDYSLSVPFEAFLTNVLSASDESLQAEFGEGYWSDHWTYNLDLIDSYLAMYPDKEDQLFTKKDYRFFDSPATVKPLKDKVSISGDKVRQYNAIEVDEEKQLRQASGKDLWLTHKGLPYQTNLFSKLLLLAGNKVSTLAPYGLGIEMEAGRPGWNDAMNGLPGMFGAGTSELYELRRLITLLLSVSSDKKVELPSESVRFLESLLEKMESVDSLGMTEWQTLTEIRESYRKSIKVKAIETVDTLTNVDALLQMMDTVVDLAIQNVETLDKELVPTYIYFEAKAEGDAITEMIPHPVTPFLEGIVKQLKTTTDKETVKEVYHKVKASDLYDQKLGMYKTSESIEKEPIELGRAKFFTPGWLENESVFLHMAYKYLLALLKTGLYDEFFEDIQTGLVAFTDPEVYGRSVLENSSFIASSANPDESIHGKGFVARLSGSTVEFLNMWVDMFIGSKPFTVEEGALSFELKPVLPSYFFENHRVSFTLFGDISVTYINKTDAPTFGEEAVAPVSYELIYADGRTEYFDHHQVKGEAALAIRDKEVKEIKVVLA
ncbi:hypothetical protein GCM10008932_08600 [Alkalibacterium iburiense]|uniref:Cellobiose phosphorylase n=1 Tax=Alkalibacterium iburiense TaxID=290589 RepID=A0ABN0X8Y6_9LACT